MFSFPACLFACLHVHLTSLSSAAAVCSWLIRLASSVRQRSPREGVESHVSDMCEGRPQPTLRLRSETSVLSRVCWGLLVWSSFLALARRCVCYVGAFVTFNFTLFSHALAHSQALRQSHTWSASQSRREGPSVSIERVRCVTLQLARPHRRPSLLRTRRAVTPPPSSPSLPNAPPSPHCSRHQPPTWRHAPTAVLRLRKDKLTLSKFNR